MLGLESHRRKEKDAHAEELACAKTAAGHTVSHAHIQRAHNMLRAMMCMHAFEFRIYMASCAKRYSLWRPCPGDIAAIMDVLRTFGPPAGIGTECKEQKQEGKGCAVSRDNDRPARAGRDDA